MANVVTSIDFSAARPEATRLEALEARVRALEEERDRDARSSAVCLVVCSGELDRLLAALTIANGAASMGSEVRIFFTFWATAALRRTTPGPRRPLLDRMIGWILPKGPGRLPLSRAHFGGLGTALMKWRMRQRQFPGLEEQLAMAAELGVKLHVCSTSLDLLGLGFDDLVDHAGLEQCGVSTFVSHALDSRVTMFF
jgi:peroxiredoxin family protein